MSERLIFITDLWGSQKSDWLIHYTRVLAAKFEIEIYDSCELGEIDTSDYTRENIHNQFINGGIERAVDKLRTSEKDAVNILAFSMGGTIAWKFGLKSGSIHSLVAVSSTRLRKETEKPNENIALYFGENDPYKPAKEWFEIMNVPYKVLPGKGHQVYCESQFAEQLSEMIIRTIPQ